MKTLRLAYVGVSIVSVLCLASPLSAEVTNIASVIPDTDAIIANYAAKSYYVAFGQLVAASLGTIALVYSLHLTRKSLQNSQTATEHASNSSKATIAAVQEAKHANDLTKTIFEADIRPWLSVNVDLYAAMKFDSSVNDLAIPLRVSVENIGRGPALDVRIYINTDISIIGADAIGRLKAYCDEAALHMSIAAHADQEIVFPQRPEVFFREMSFFTGDDRFFDRRVPVIVFYRSSALERYYCTAGVYRVTKIVGAANVALSPQDRTLSVDEMMLTKFPIKYAT